AVLLGLDRVVLAAADDDQLLRADLVAAGRTGLGAYDAGDVDAGLLRERVEGLPGLGRDLALGEDCLNDAAAVAEHGEADATVGARRLDPAPHRHILSDVLGESPDFRDHCHGVSRLRTRRLPGVR